MVTAQHRVSIQFLRPAHLAGLQLILPQSIVTGAIELQDSNRGWPYCLLLNGAPVGLAVLTAEGEIMAYVDPTYQRQGLATSALAKLIGRAEGADMPRVHARVRKGDAGASGAAVATRLGLSLVQESDEELFFERRFRPRVPAT